MKDERRHHSQKEKNK